MHTRHASSIIQANKASELLLPNYSWSYFIHAKNHAADKLQCYVNFTKLVYLSLRVPAFESYLWQRQ